MEEPGFEPGAFRMRSERDTTTPYSLIEIPNSLVAFNRIFCFVGERDVEGWIKVKIKKKNFD